jgi:hypothetical protein
MDTSDQQLFFSVCYGTVWCGIWDHQARLVFWPARAHPFWSIRGVCPLHKDLEKRLGSEDKRDRKKHLRMRVLVRWTHQINIYFSSCAMELSGAAFGTTRRIKLSKKLSKSCQKFSKNCKNLTKSCQKSSQKWSKSCEKKLQKS